ncbi:MAG: DinB family protein [Bryobacteraceae bacterium]|nr:DinB family protein [Bryobacteraceae bacterium]
MITKRTFLLSSLAASATLQAADAGMTVEERAKALQWWEQAGKEFLAVIDGVTPAQWTWRPAEGRWTVGEVAEHVVLAEALLFGAVKKLVASPVNPDWAEKTKGKTAILEMAIAPRRGKAQAPETIVPKGGMTLAVAKERFLAARVEMLEFTRTTEVALKEHTQDNPFFGTLNGYHWLIYAPMHTLRHVKQMVEVKQTSGYPAA